MNIQQQIGAILAEAFINYPLMRFAFDGKTEEVRKQKLLQLYTHCTTAAAIYGGAILNKEVNGALIWLPGSAFPLGLLREVKSGMAAIPFKLGAKSTLRLMNHDAVPEGWIAKNAGPAMGYIWCVGVKASARGKGLSRVLIEESIAQMRSGGMREFWLKTEDPVNVGIYQKLGFEVVNEMVVSSSGLRSWMMRKT
ncbi:MAG: GNAT family N-acetyltransferase [Chitinophagales bacterium]